MSTENPHVLDLSNISPSLRYMIASHLIGIVADYYRILCEDIPHYDTSTEAYRDMVQWRDGASQLIQDLKRLK